MAVIYFFLPLYFFSSPFIFLSDYSSLATPLTQDLVSCINGLSHNLGAQGLCTLMVHGLYITLVRGVASETLVQKKSDLVESNCSLPSRKCVRKVT
jgi:hypothetical protein